MSNNLPSTEEQAKVKLKELREAAEPLIKYLNENCNPHTTVIVTPTSVELLGGIMTIPKIFDFVKDQVMDFIQKHTVNNIMILDKNHLKTSIAQKLKNRQLKPRDISFKDMLQSVKNNMRPSMLIQHKVSVVFKYDNRKYLLIFNT